MEEEGSLHLSDLSLGQVSESVGFSPRSEFFVSDGKLTDLDNMRDYASYLYDTKSKLECTQAAFESEIKRSRAKLKNDEEEMKSQITGIKEQEMKLRSQRAQNDKAVARERKNISDLEGEEVRIEKSVNWAQSVLENKNDFNMRKSLRNEIIQKVSDIEEITEHIRVLRNAVFGQQKTLTEMSDSITSLRVKSYTLSARIDAVMEDNEEEREASTSTLNETMSQTRTVAITQQRLAIEKMRIQKRIGELSRELEELRTEKADVLEKLTPLRIRDYGAVDKILLQRDQYVAATSRHREMVQSVISAKDDCVAKELDVKIEQDKIAEAKGKVVEEIEKAKQTLKEQSDRIEELKQWLSNSSVTPDKEPEEITYESILKDTISEIRRKREEATALENMEIANEEFDETELDEARSRIEARLQKTQDAVVLAKRETESIRFEVTELESELTGTRSQISETPRQLPQTPKMARELARIHELEASIAKTQQKCQKKRDKIAKHRETIQELRAQISSPHQKYLVVRDIVSRVEVSAHWLMGNLRKAKAQWAAASTFTQMTQLAKEWESKIMAAAVNEAEDLEMRGSAVAD